MRELDREPGPKRDWIGIVTMVASVGLLLFDVLHGLM
jgi:hypothetical protein